MRIVYALLSPTFGMHQYTADIANRMARQGHEVHLVTTTHVPRDRYATAVTLHSPVTTTNTGLSRETLQWNQYRQTLTTIFALKPDLVHFTGPHLWNASLVFQLKQRGCKVIHTIHDLDPHSGLRLGRLLHIWNRLIIRASDHILVHGEAYRQRLQKHGVPAHKISCTPLLFLFLSDQQTSQLDTTPVYAEPFALFFGRFEPYKGLDGLLHAYSKIADVLAQASNSNPRLVLAGSGALPSRWVDKLPPGVELRNRFIGDTEALDLFRRCSLVVLPYTDATQSGLIASAYYFGKPVLVTRSGALPEYVEDGRTGFIVSPNNVDELAQTMMNAFADTTRLQKMGAAGRIWYESQRAKELNTLLKLYTDQVNSQTVSRKFSVMEV